jgi:predicted HAD superfamily Cof-like phosphohydrolase
MSSDNKELTHLTSIEQTKSWFDQAIPEPTDAHKCIQIGVHYEEVAEMLGAMCDEYESHEVNELSLEYKICSNRQLDMMSRFEHDDKIDLLDSLADQIVTAIGVAHMFGFDIAGALAEVNRSNFSKFEDGKPVFDANGKITKGKNYTPPDLTPYI